MILANVGEGTTVATGTRSMNKLDRLPIESRFVANGWDTSINYFLYPEKLRNSSDRTEIPSCD